MWIAAPFGFLMPADRTEYTPKGDKRTLQIRARRAQDLDILRALYMQGRLGSNIHTPDKDYEYRAYCEPIDFKIAMSKMIDDIDYLKFKPTTSRFADNDLHRLYNRIWSLVLQELSTPQHQDEYWRKNTPAQPYPGAQGVYTSSSYKPSATGYPKVIGPTSTVDQAITDYDTERERLDRWLAEHRDTSVTRDYVLPEIDGWDDDDVPVTASITSKVDDLYDEIDAILDGHKQRDPVKHEFCHHAATPNAKAKCRAKHRRQAERRITALREQIAEAHRDFEQDKDKDNADPANWAGYPWDRKTRSAHAL